MSPEEQAHRDDEAYEEEQWEGRALLVAAMVGFCVAVAVVVAFLVVCITR